MSYPIAEQNGLFVGAQVVSFINHLTFALQIGNDSWKQLFSLGHGTVEVNY